MKKVAVVFILAVLLMLMLFLINSRFDTFKDPAEFEEYSDP